MYKTFEGLNLPEIDREVLAFWEANDIFEKSVDQKDPNNSFVFYEGPPSANGKPGIHHVMARTVKDLFCRFQTMKGKRVDRKGGWDTHGLPIELSVEKELGITKEDIGSKISVDDYNKACRETVMRYKDMWDDITRKMGYWVDLENPYITFENNYIESVWYLLKRLYDKDLLYKGYTIQPYSPAAGTGLSSHELNMPGAYQDVTDTSAIAQFKLLENEQSQFLFNQAGPGEVFILAWTTTPWTLPSNTALAVGKKIDYVFVQTWNQYTQEPINIVLAKALVGKQLSGKYRPLEEGEALSYTTGDKKIPYKILDEFKGETLVDIRYEQLLPFVLPYKDADQAFRVVPGSFVTTDDGTGIVHIAPTFGSDDAMVGKETGIPAMLVLDENDDPVPLVDLQGKFRPEVGEFAGISVKNEYYSDEERPEKSADVLISIKLKTENRAFKVEKYLHSYPHCWRTDKPVLYYPLDSWFIRAASMKERMFELNKTINWKPASTGEGRFGKWLENLQDWNLSRSRFWGIPLPIWMTEDGKQQRCIGSVAELQAAIAEANEKLGKNQEVPKDLHRPYIDDVVLVAENGAPMYREKDLIDVWFDSGSMPYAQWHYPFENQEKFKQNFPADFIAEGVDQTRGWFYTLHAIAVMAFDSVAFKNVVSNGLVQDKNGQKMSKRLGNAVEPFETLAQYGADATRWYMLSNAQPWDNLKFDVSGIQEVQRKFFGTLYNTYSFFTLYANIDGFSYKEAEVTLADRPEIDRWIISLLNTLIKEVEADYADYEATNATRRIQNFVDEHLSNWYVRLCRRRFWKGEYSTDKIAAYQTLYTCMTTIAKLMAPVAPFFSDWLYNNFNTVTQKEKAESVHLADFPSAQESLMDKALEQRMDYAQRISSLVLSLRKKERIRVRQPLRKIMLPVLDQNFQLQVDGVKDLILSEVNVKELEYITDTSGIIKKGIKPNFKTLGRRLGKNMNAAAQVINGFGQEYIAAIVKAGGYQLTIGEEQFDLTLEDFEITTQDIPGWLVASDGPLTVAMDITLTDQLLAEGTARELINRIQNLRKSKDFNVTDKIVVTLEKHEAISSAVDHFSDYICNETLASALHLRESVTGDQIDLNEEVSLGIEVNLAN
ncbi:MAG: isoleucine--tRNA ligase [Bacteroidota bacterium]